MPRVYLTRQGELNNRIVKLIYGTMKLKGISQTYLADKLGVKQPSLNRKLKTAHFTFADLATIFEVLELEDEEILSVMRLRKER